MTVKIGVIGAGSIAEKHFNAYNNNDDVEIKVTDIDSSKKQKAEKYGYEWFSDQESLLRSEIDAVDICTPVPTHHELIVRALEAGKDVFCEKPLVASAKEAESIQTKAEQSTNFLMVGYLYRYHPAFQFAKSVLTGDIIGTPYYAMFRVGGRGSSRAWKHRASEGGGVSNEMLVHMLDLILWYFDEINDVEILQKEIVLREREIDGETIEATANDVILLKIKTGSEVEVICQSDLITPSYMNYVEIQGQNGSLWTTILDYFPTFVYCKRPRGIFDRGHNFRDFDRIDLFEKELNHFSRAVAGFEEPKWDSLQDSVQVHRIIDEIRE